MTGVNTGYGVAREQRTCVQVLDSSAEHRAPKFSQYGVEASEYSTSKYAAVYGGPVSVQECAVTA